MKKSICIMMILFSLLLIGGCGKGLESFETTGTTCGNIMMGSGKFAYMNDFIYVYSGNQIYEYDMVTKTVVSISTNDEMARNLILNDSYIYYLDGGLHRVSKDGKKHKEIFKRENGIINLYIDGMDAYFLNYIEGDLIHRNLKSGKETTLINKVMAYYVDETKIYAIAKDEEIPCLYVSERDGIDFKVVELSFSPIMVLVAKEDIYLAERGTYQVVRVHDGVEERLPIKSLFYQVAEEKILYLDADTYGDSCFQLKSYDVTSKICATLCENVYDFNLFENRYVCIDYGLTEDFKLYDMETGELKDLFNGNDYDE